MPYGMAVVGEDPAIVVAAIEEAEADPFKPHHLTHADTCHMHRTKRSLCVRYNPI